MQDRRKQDRKQDANTVDLKPYTDYLHSFIKGGSFALTENLSVGGVKIITDTFLPLDAVIRLQINMARSRQKVILPGKVKWITEHRDEHIYEMGFEFVDISKKNSTTLREYLS